MASLNDLSNQIESFVVNDADGWGDPVTFTYRKTNISVNVNAMCMDLTNSRLNEKAQVYEDGMAFMSVFLTTRPAKGDLVAFEGRNYVVETMEGRNPYDLFCRTNTRHSRARSSRVEK